MLFLGSFDGSLDVNVLRLFLDSSDWLAIFKCSEISIFCKIFEKLGLQISLKILTTAFLDIFNLRHEGISQKNNIEEKD